MTRYCVGQPIATVSNLEVLCECLYTQRARLKGFVAAIGQVEGLAVHRLRTGIFFNVQGPLKMFVTQYRVAEPLGT